MTPVEVLTAMGACEEGVSWARQHGGSADRLWRDCRAGSWMAWYAGKLHEQETYESEAYREIYAVALEMARLSGGWWFEGSVKAAFERICAVPRAVDTLASLEPRYHDIGQAIDRREALFGRVHRGARAGWIVRELQEIVRDSGIRAVRSLVTGRMMVLFDVIKSLENGIVAATALAFAFGDESLCRGFSYELSAARRKMSSGGDYALEGAATEAAYVLEARAAYMIRGRMPSHDIGSRRMVVA